PDVSPNGFFVVFVSYHPFTGFSQTFLHVTSIDQDDQQLLVNEIQNVDSPTWSPSSQQILYTRNELDGTTSLYIANIDDSVNYLLTNGNMYYTGFSWSPDGNRILFSGRISS